ncbi:MAG: class I SAM-dependent methyltransferase [Planctomycetes bacterium]|nr:class I SAM-dependent methyltransferase [Planctomycetota bacterium]MCB9903153.1 class I SAM-dependent methyltransferase [Planctomycetota bacterium]
MTPPGERWFESAFRRDYLALYAHRDAAEARVQVDRLLALGFGCELVDLACGVGRHVEAFALRGVRVVGVDRSDELLGAATRDVRGQLVLGDLRRLPFRTESFDGALSLFSSFGYFGPEEDRVALAEAARVLRPGGRLCLDLADPEQVRAGLVARSEKRVGDVSFRETRELAEGGRLVIKRVESSGGPDGPRSWQELLWLYEDGELARFAADAGLRVEQCLAGWGAGLGAALEVRRVWTLRRA